MPIRIRYACPHCGRRIVHQPEYAGQLVICSVCKGEFYEPTDPLPGKPAEKALEPLPDAARRLRVPEGDNPRHDLALLSRRDSSDMRSITEIVEAVLLDAEPPARQPEPSETIADFGYASLSEEAQEGARPAIPAWDPPTAKARGAAKVRSPQYIPPSAKGSTGLAGPTVRPLVPSRTPPSAVVSSPGMLRSVPKPGVPGASPGKGPAAAQPLSGASVKQMLEEIRRRGLGVALVTCDLAPMRNFELAFSENLTRYEAIALLRGCLESLGEPVARPSEPARQQKGPWKTDEEGHSE